MQREHLSVEELAYRLWEARGRPQGSSEQDWLDAERQLAAAHAPPPAPSAAPAARAKQPTSKALDDALKGSFPASDPPAAHLPDEPPINADEKWQAAGRTRTGSRPKAPAKAAGSAQTGTATNDMAAPPKAAAAKPKAPPAAKAKKADAGKGDAAKKPSSPAPKSP